ncbi:MAG: hypothetical protein ABUT20_59970 [Bacteroidota bacterium]
MMVLLLLRPTRIFSYISMQEFKIKQEGLKEIQHLAIKKAVPLFIIVIAVVIAVNLFQSKDKELDIYVLLIALPLAGLLIGFSFYRGLKRQRKLLESFTLTLTENMIMREQLNTPPIGIYLKEVTEITKHTNGTFMIRGTDKRDLICVPRQIEKYTQLEIELNRIKPVRLKTSRSFLQRFYFLPGLLFIGSMITVYIATNKVAVAIAGFIFVGLAVWVIVTVQRSKNVNSRAKRGMWWMLFLVASVIYIVITKLLGL